MLSSKAPNMKLSNNQHNLEEAIECIENLKNVITKLYEFNNAYKSDDKGIDVKINIRKDHPGNLILNCSLKLLKDKGEYNFNNVSKIINGYHIRIIIEVVKTKELKLDDFCKLIGYCKDKMVKDDQYEQFRLDLITELKQLAKEKFNVSEEYLSTAIKDYDQVLSYTPQSHHSIQGEYDDNEKGVNAEILDEFSISLKNIALRTVKRLNDINNCEVFNKDLKFAFKSVFSERHNSILELQQASTATISTNKSSKIKNIEEVANENIDVNQAPTFQQKELEKIFIALRDRETSQQK